MKAYSEVAKLHEYSTKLETNNVEGHRLNSQDECDRFFMIETGDMRLQ